MARQVTKTLATIIMVALFVSGVAATVTVIPTDASQSNALSAYHFTLGKAYSSWQGYGSYDPSLATEYGEIPILWGASGTAAGDFLWPDTVSAGRNFDFSTGSAYSTSAYQKAFCLSIPGENSVAILQGTVKDMLGMSCTWQYPYYQELFNKLDYSWDLVETAVDSELTEFSWRTKLVIIPAFATYAGSSGVYMDETAAMYPDISAALNKFLNSGGTIYAEGNAGYLLEVCGILPQGSINLDDYVEGAATGLCEVTVVDYYHPISFDIPSSGIYTVLGPTIADDIPEMKTILTVASSWDPADVGKPLVVEIPVNGGRVILNAGMPTTGIITSDDPNQWQWAVNALMAAFTGKVMSVRSVLTDADVESVDVAPIALPVNQSDTFEVTIRVRNLWDTPINNVSVNEEISDLYTYVGTSSGPAPTIMGQSITYNIGTMAVGEEVIITYLIKTPDDEDSRWYSITDYVDGDGYAAVASSKMYYTDPADGVVRWSYRNDIKVRFLFEAEIVADTDLNWKNILGEFFQPFKIFSIFENKERTSALHTKYVQYIPLDVPIYWVAPMDIPIIRTPGGKFVDVLRGDWDRNKNGKIDPNEIFRDMNNDGNPDAWLDVNTMHPQPDEWPPSTWSVEEIYWLNPWSNEFEDIDHDGIRPVDVNGDGIFEVEDPGDKIRALRMEYSHNLDPFPGYGWYDPYASWELWIDPPPLLGMAIGAAEAAGSLIVDLDTMSDIPEPYNYENWEHWMETDSAGEIVWKRLVFVHFGSYEGFVFLNDGETVPDPNAIDIGHVPWPRREYIAVLNLGGDEPTMTDPTCDSSRYSYVEYKTIWGKEKKTPIRVSYTYYAPLPNPLQFEYISCTYEITDPPSGEQMQYLPKYGEADLTFNLCASTEYSRYWLKNVGQDYGEYEFYYDGSVPGWRKTAMAPDGLGDGVVGYMVHEIPKGIGNYRIDLPRNGSGDIDIDAIVEGFFPYIIGDEDVGEEIVVYELPFKWQILIPQILIPPALDDDDFDGTDDWDDDFGDRFVSRTGYLHDIYPPFNGEYAESIYALSPWDLVDIEGDLAVAHKGWCPGADSSYGDDLCEHLGETRLVVHAKYHGEGREGVVEINKGVWLVNEEIFGGSPWVQWSHAQFAFAKGHSIYVNRNATPTVVPIHPDTVIMRWRIAEWDEPKTFDIMYDPYLDGTGYGDATITTHVGGREPASLFEPDGYWNARIDPRTSALGGESQTITAIPWASGVEELEAHGYPKTEHGAFLQIVIEVDNTSGKHWYQTTVKPDISALGASELFLWYGCYPRPLVPQHVTFDSLGEPHVQSGDDPRTFTAGWRFNPSADEVLFQVGDADGSIMIPEIQSSRRAYFIYHIKLDPNLLIGVYDIPFTLSGYAKHYTESGSGTPVSYDVPTAKFAVVERVDGTIVSDAKFVSAQATLNEFTTELRDYVTIENPSSDVRWTKDQMPTPENWASMAPTGASVVGSGLSTPLPAELASPWPPDVELGTGYYVNNFWLGAKATVAPPMAADKLPLDYGAELYYDDFMDFTRIADCNNVYVTARGAQMTLRKRVSRVNGVDVAEDEYFFLEQGPNELVVEMIATNIGNDIAHDIAIDGQVGDDAELISADSTYEYTYDPQTKVIHWPDFAHIPPGAERVIPVTIEVEKTEGNDLLCLFCAFAVEFWDSLEGDTPRAVRYRPENPDTIFYGMDLFFEDGDLSCATPEPAVGDNVTLTAKVRIDGNTMAKSFVVRFFEGGTQIGTDQIINALAPSDSFATVSVPFEITADYHTLYVIVDPDSLIGELDEKNNTTTLELVIGKGAPIRQVVNVPNPFRDYTEFTYILGKPMTDVAIKVFTVRGQPVRNFDMCPASYGYNAFGWDGTDSRGDQIANGTYIYKVVATDEDGEKHEVIERLVRMR